MQQVREAETSAGRDVLCGLVRHYIDLGKPFLLRSELVDGLEFAGVGAYIGHARALRTVEVAIYHVQDVAPADERAPSGGVEVDGRHPIVAVDEIFADAAQRWQDESAAAVGDAATIDSMINRSTSP